MNIHTRVWAVHLLRLVDITTALIIGTMMVFGPWAFGCASSQTLQNITLLGITQSWNVWVFEIGGLLLGLSVVCGTLLRRLSGVRPPVLNSPVAYPYHTSNSWVLSASKVLAVLTISITGYAAIAMLNSRSTFNPSDFSFTYHPHIPWLPHSFDRSSSIKSLVALAGMAAFFWGLLFWLVHNRHPSNLAPEKKTITPDKTSSCIPDRLKALLWVMTINGCLLAIESMAQRLSGTNRLLWLITPHLNSSAEFEFGPYAYRANAAQYFNILWPVSMGFWWWLQNEPQRTTNRRLALGVQPSHIVLVCVILMAACPIISGSRGGSLITLTLLPAAIAILIFSARKTHGATRLGLFLLMLLILGLGLYFEGDSLAARMQDFNTNLAQREEIYSAAKAMSREHPLFGTGPGTFETLFQFYRNSTEDYWPAQLHNDWLETVITFGWLGSSLLWLSLLLVFIRWFLPGGTSAPWQFAAFLWMGMGSALIHARFDYPFQILSISALFLTVCAALFSISRSTPG